MRNFFLILISLTGFITACISNNPEQINKPFYRPDWRGVDTAKLQLKFGQLIEFTYKNERAKALVLDCNKDSAGIWFGFCFLQGDSLFGRSIPSGEATGYACIDLEDLIYLNTKDLPGYRVISRLDVDFEKIDIGSFTPVKDSVELFAMINWGIEKRKQKQTPCDEKLTMLNPVNECYLPLRKIIR